MSIHLLGEIILYLALLIALLQSTIPLYGAKFHNAYALACARPCAFLQYFFIIGAYLLLTWGFISDDFSLRYVAENSHPSLPLIYKITATWGAHEGSILLWILILNTWSIIFALVAKTTRLQSVTLSILGMISTAFLAFLLFTSDPFSVMPAHIQQMAMDLNPLLQDPGLVSHPPMLYMGYVGFSVAFALTFAALLLNQLDENWAKLTRQFALLAFSFLTLGIVLGSLWAYRVLGWGGFWFWDPVENASLLPWLSGIALIHVLVLVEKRKLAERMAVILALLSFLLSLLGTFLVRSGVLISAHTFANDPKRGLFLLLLLAGMVAISVLIYFIRLPSTLFAATTNKNQFGFFARETKLLLNSAFLILALLTILIGTLYPLILDALHLGTISVGAPYFNSVLLPINMAAMMFMGLAPFCKWQQPKHDHRYLLQQTWRKASFSFLLCGILYWSLSLPFAIDTFLNLTLSIWIICSVTQGWRLKPALFFAHGGFAMMIAGIVLSSALSLEREVKLQVGQSVELGPYQFLFLATKGTNGDNYRGVEAYFDVMKRHHHIVYLKPEKRIYLVRDMVINKVAIHASVFRDLYLALGEPFNDNEWSLRIYYKPFIRLIWIGGASMMFAGFIALFKRRRREGIPIC